MNGNIFTQGMFALAAILRERPRISTTVAALMLSTVWMLAWLTVFAATTIALELNTTARDFIIVLWLSVAVEAVIRWAENTLFIAYISKPSDPNPKPDNKDYRAGRAALTFISLTLVIGLSFAIVSDMDDIMLPLVALSFSGAHESTTEGWLKMFSGWLDTFLDQTVITCVVLAVAGRAIIYKSAVLDE